MVIIIDKTITYKFACFQSKHFVTKAFVIHISLSCNFQPRFEISLRAPKAGVRIRRAYVLDENRLMKNQRQIQCKISLLSRCYLTFVSGLLYALSSRNGDTRSSIGLTTRGA